MVAKIYKVNKLFDTKDQKKILYGSHVNKIDFKVKDNEAKGFFD